MTRRSQMRKQAASAVSQDSTEDVFAGIDRARLARLLEQHALGRRKLEATQVRAIELVLRKTVPDVMRRPPPPPKSPEQEDELAEFDD